MAKRQARQPDVNADAASTHAHPQLRNRTQSRAPFRPIADMHDGSAAVASIHIGRKMISWCIPGSGCRCACRRASFIARFNVL